MSAIERAAEANGKKAGVSKFIGKSGPVGGVTEAKKRHRRTKAEMELERAREAAKTKPLESAKDSLAKGKTRAKQVETPVVMTESAEKLLNCIAFIDNVKNVTKMFAKSKGDMYCEYAEQFPKNKRNYPTLRAAIEKDLLSAPTNTVLVNGKEKVCFPWGFMTIKAKAHSMACGILKAYQVKQVKIAKGLNKVEVELFSKWDKKANEGKGKAETKMTTVTRERQTPTFDPKRAAAFLDSFLK